MRGMKDSGIEWIGKIPDDWSLTKLKYIVQSPLQYGANESGIGYSDELPRYIRITDITLDNKLKEEGKLSLEEDTAKPYLLYDKDILFARSGASVGKTFLYRIQYGKAAFAGYLIRAIINSNEVIPDFVYYNTLGHNYEAWKQRIFIQSTIQNIGADKFNDYIFAYPSISKQQAIVKFLDGKCAKIDKILSRTRASIEEYKKLKQAVITQAVTKGIRGNRTMKNSGIEWIGEIPTEWSIVALKVLCSMNAGKTLSSEQILDEGEYAVYGGNGLRGYYSQYNNQGSCLLIGRQGALCGNVHRVDGVFWATEHAVVTKCSKLSDRDFLYYLLIGMNLNQYAFNTAAQPGLSVGEITNIRTVLVPIKEQQEIADHLDKMCEEIDALIVKKTALLEEMENYKKSIIYEYVTGKKEVSMELV